MRLADLPIDIHDASSAALHLAHKAVRWTSRRACAVTRGNVGSAYWWPLSPPPLPWQVLPPNWATPP